MKKKKKKLSDTKKIVLAHRSNLSNFGVPDVVIFPDPRDFVKMINHFKKIRIFKKPRRLRKTNG